MTPGQLLAHYDAGQLWSEAWSEAPSVYRGFDVPTAYQRALEVRKLRMARGERPLGFKIGFTNRTIWSRYQVFAPNWSFAAPDAVADGALHARLLIGHRTPVRALADGAAAWCCKPCMRLACVYRRPVPCV